MEFMSDKIAPVTYNLRLIYLKAFFDWCVDEGYLDKNPLEKFKKRKAEPRIVDISEDILKKLLKLPDRSTFAGLRDYALILFTLDTGIRPSEALQLKKENFDLHHLVVTVPATSAKTRTTRTLPILPQTAEVIWKLIKVRHPSWDDNIPVFCSSDGTPLRHRSWSYRMRKYSQQLGVKIRPYDLRHAFALLYLRNGGHAFALQKMLGHTDMSMTKRYVNLSGDDLQKTHQKASPLNKIIEKKQKRIRKIKMF